MNPLIFLNWRLWAVLGLAAALAFTGWKAYHMGAEHVQAQWDAEKVAVAEQQRLVTKQNEVQSAQLQTQADQQKEADDEQTRIINARFTDTYERLHNRPDRPSGPNMPNSACNGAGGPGVTGAGLYRVDGQFLARYAADRAILQVGLQSCYTKYGEVKAALDAIGKQNASAEDSAGERGK